MSDASLILSIGSGLRNELGWRRRLLVVSGVADGRALFNRSHCATLAAPAGEAKYLKRLSPLAELYSQLLRIQGPEQALRVMRQVISSIPLRLNELAKVDLSGLSGIGRLVAFRRHGEDNTVP